MTGDLVVRKTESWARAPGKIIVCGEHAVVHGSAALTASIDLYTTVHVQLLPSSSSQFSNSTSGGDEGSLVLKLRDMWLEYSWPINRVKTVLSESGVQLPMTADTVSCPPELIKAIHVLLEDHAFPEARIGISSGVSAFLWLFSSIQGVRPATVTITSDLPIGSGLGSSASYCVSLAAALLALSGFRDFGFGSSDWMKLKEADLELVNRWAFEGEKLIHGKPSGIDNSISTYGNMIMFKSGKLTHVKPSFPIRMLITNTKVGRNTKALVAAVGERASRHSKAISSVFEAINAISEEVCQTIQSPISDRTSITELEEKLEELMDMNQGLLQCLGVSHSSIEMVLQVTSKYKLVSKLTGAGGGGCVLTMLPALLPDNIIQKVIVELKSHGFECFIISAGRGSLEVCCDGDSQELKA